MTTAEGKTKTGERDVVDYSKINRRNGKIKMKRRSSVVGISGVARFLSTAATNDNGS
jgi:hypothetical protein